MNKCKLGDVASVIISNVDKKSYENEIKVKLCNFTDVYYNWAITLRDEPKLMIATATNNEICKYKLHKGDVAITKDSETKEDIGQSTLIADEIPDMLLGYHCALIRPNTDKLLGAYLNAVLHTKLATRYFELNASGSGQRYTLSVDAINDFQLYLPSINEQERISKILTDIDRKIENNTCINDNLAQQAKLLYDYWFTQFDFPDENDKPYRSSGGQMVWNDLLKKKIPLGWEVKTLSELLKKNTQSFDYSSVQPTIDLSVMPSDTIALSQINSSDNFSTNLYVMKKGDILFGSIRPYLHKAGIAPCDGAVAGTVHSYHTINPNDYNFSLLTMARDSFFDYAVNTSSGTKMPVVSSDSILSFKFAYSKEVAKKFNSVPIMEIITRNVQETQRLIKLRDFLLPLLMNGQATIAE